MILILACLAFILLIVILAVQIVMIIDACMTNVPWVGTRSDRFPLIMKHMKLSDTSVVYDLGCGGAQLLSAISEAFPQAKVCGIEKGLLPYIYARIRTRSTPVRILYGSYLNISIQDATHIYCYLSTWTMEKLSLKFKNECKPGTCIVTCCFTLPGWEPVLTLKSEDKHRLNQDLYFYIK